MEIEELLGGGWPPARAQLQQMLEEACVDAHDAYEQIGGIHCVLEELGALPCPASVRGSVGVLISVDARESFLVGLVRFDGLGELPIPLEDVVPTPGGPAAFLVAMYRLWLAIEPPVLVGQPEFATPSDR